MLKKFMCLLWGVLLVAPSALLAANSTAQDFDDLGMALYQKGLYDKAIVYFQKAVQADPGDWQGYENLGDAYSKNGDNQDALNAYQQSLRIHPDNPTVQAHIDSLGGTSNTVSPANPPSNSQVEQEAPVQNNKAGQFRRYRPQPADSLAPMDHAKVWAKFELGYNYSVQGDLMNSVTALNGENANGTLPFGFTNGNASMDAGGFNSGGEVGFLINPNNGIAIGFHYLQANDYTYSAYNSAPSSIAGYPSDFETTTMTPSVVPFTLDYYLFLPDSGGRFFISAGVGYYAANVHVDENYSVVNYEYTAGDPNYQNDYNHPFGDLTAGNVGFQVGIGRDFAVNPNFGISIFARGRYARISNFRGTLSDGNPWVLAKYADGTVDIDNPSFIGTNGETYATVDFTGFDIGASLNFYSF